MLQMVMDDEWDLYPDFSKKEMACRHTGDCLVTHKLMAKLQAIRNEFKQPMQITSGFRDLSHPAERNKKEIGEHSKGLAADIRISGPAALVLLGVAIAQGVRRIGISQKGLHAQRYIHIGVGEVDGYPPGIWTY